MENTRLELEERTFGLDIIPLLLASALAVILGQNFIDALMMEASDCLTSVLTMTLILRIHFKK